MKELRLRLAVLGTFDLRMPDGRRIEVPSRKSRALLALLALARDGERTREWLQAMLWGSRGVAQAQASLRRELSNLRAILSDFVDPEAVLISCQERVELALDRFEIDVREISDGRRPASGLKDCGELLEGLHLPGEAAFAKWLEGQRGVIALMCENAASDAWERSMRFRLSQPTVATEAPDPQARDVRPAIAVMPFDVANPDMEQSAMETEAALAAALARHSTLHAVSLIDALGSRDALRSQSIRTLSREFRVAYFLAGKSGGDFADIDVALRLVDAVDFTQIWSERLDCSVSLEETAQRAAVQIDSAIERNERNRALHELREGSDQAWLFWRANSLFRRWQPDALREAIGLLEILTEVDPFHGWGLPLLAFCHAIEVRAGWAPDAQAGRARAHALIEQAGSTLEEDPFALGYLAGALWALGGKDWRASEIAERALAIHPGLPASLFWAGLIDLSTGKIEQARERFLAALSCNPDSAVAPLLRACSVLCDLCDQKHAVEACIPVFATLDAVAGRDLMVGLARDPKLVAVLETGFAALDRPHSNPATSSQVLTPGPIRPGQDWSGSGAVRA